MTANTLEQRALLAYETWRDTPADGDSAWPKWRAVVEVLRLSAGEDWVLVSKSEFQRALEGIHVPKMSPVKQECFKAGTRAVILAFNGVFDSPRHEPGEGVP